MLDWKSIDKEKNFKSKILHQIWNFQSRAETVNFTSLDCWILIKKSNHDQEKRASLCQNWLEDKETTLYNNFCQFIGNENGFFIFNCSKLAVDWLKYAQCIKSQRGCLLAHGLFLMIFTNAFYRLIDFCDSLRGNMRELLHAWFTF